MQTQYGNMFINPNSSQVISHLDATYLPPAPILATKVSSISASNSPLDIKPNVINNNNNVTNNLGSMGKVFVGGNSQMIDLESNLGMTRMNFIGVGDHQTVSYHKSSSTDSNILNNNNFTNQYKKSGSNLDSSPLLGPTKVDSIKPQQVISTITTQPRQIIYTQPQNIIVQQAPPVKQITQGTGGTATNFFDLSETQFVSSNLQNTVYLDQKEVYHTQMLQSKPAPSHNVYIQPQIQPLSNSSTLSFSSFANKFEANSSPFQSQVPANEQPGAKHHVNPHYPELIKAAESKGDIDTLVPPGDVREIFGSYNTNPSSNVNPLMDKSLAPKKVDSGFYCYNGTNNHSG